MNYITTWLSVCIQAYRFGKLLKVPRLNWKGLWGFMFYVLRFTVNCYQRFKSKFFRVISRKYLKNWGGQNYDQNFSLFALSLKFLFSVACSRHNETAVRDCAASSPCWETTWPRSLHPHSFRTDMVLPPALSLLLFLSLRLSYKQWILHSCVHSLLMDTLANFI